MKSKTGVWISYLIGGSLIILIIVWGISTIHRGANDRLHTKHRQHNQAVDAGNADFQKRQAALQQKRQRDIAAAKATWQGPRYVMVQSIGASKGVETLARDGKIYVIATLGGTNTPATDIFMRPVPIELTDGYAPVLKYWRCVRPANGCDAGFDQFYPADSATKPYAEAVAKASRQIDFDIAQARIDTTAAKLDHTRAKSLLGAAFHNGLVVICLVVVFILGLLFFIFIPDWFWLEE